MEVLLVGAQIITDITEVDSVVHSMSIVAYMTFLLIATALRYLDITLNPVFPTTLSHRRGKWKIKPMSQVGSFLGSEAKVARREKIALKRNFWTAYNTGS